MKAIQMAQTGGPDVLRSVDVADPEVEPRHVIVATKAAGLNFIDTYHRRGVYPVSLPFIPGLEGAGVIVEIGPEVDGVGVGDRVAWAMAPGSYAELNLIPVDKLFMVPDEASLELAAALPLQGLTAHYLADATYSIRPTDRVLIHAGAGGVGLLLIQIAKMRGAEVFTTVSDPDKAGLASGAGADHVIRYDQEDFGDVIEKIAGERPLAVIYDGVGAATFDRGLTLLRPRGMMVLFGQASGPVPPVDLQVLAQNGSVFVTRPTLGDYVSDPSERDRRANDLFRWVGQGELSVRVGQRYPLADAAQAHRDLESRATTGKSLLVP